MKRHFNLSIWLGFLIVVASVASYIPIFTVFASTRDVPWANYVLFLAGGALLAVGLQRAFRDPEHYRGKVSGPILGTLSVLIAGFFVAFILYGGRQIPASENALRESQAAPSFTLADADGKLVSSSELLKNHRALLLIFYRGYWWPFCNSELRSFQQRLGEFHDRGVEILAISVDSAEESRKLCQAKGYSFPFLSDAKAEVIRKYGVLHPAGGENGKDIARPTEFLVDSSGMIRWVNLTEDLRVRARPQMVLDAIKRL
jgi:peroxiredoxin